MRAVFGLVLILGMGLAGFAVYMVKGYVSQTQSALDQERLRAAAITETVDVLAVNRAIAYGEFLTVEDVDVIKYAKPFLPAGVFLTEEALFPEGTNIPRAVLRAMEANEPVLAIKVTEPGEDADITQRLEPGMRAFTVRVDVTSGVSGFLRPGNFVDVYWSGNLPGSNGRNQSVTRLIRSNIELIAVDQSSDEARIGAAIARTVTVQVSPQDVAALTQAQSSGKLTLSLVGAGDNVAIAGAIEVDQNTLLNIQEAPAVPVAAPAPAPEICSIKTRRGADIIETVIPCDN